MKDRGSSGDRRSLREGGGQGELHRAVEARLAFVRVHGLVGGEDVADREDGQRAATLAGGERVQLRRLHFDRDHARGRPHLPLVRVVVGVEEVGAQDVAGADLPVARAGRENRGDEQVGVRQGREVETLEPPAVEVGVRASALGDDQVSRLHVVPQSSAGAHADDRLHVELVEELVGVDRQGRHSHARSLYRHADFAEVRDGGHARESEYAAHGVVLHDVAQDLVGDALGAQGVAGEQDSASDLTRVSIDVE